MTRSAPLLIDVQRIYGAHDADRFLGQVPMQELAPIRRFDLGKGIQTTERAVIELLGRGEI